MKRPRIPPRLLRRLEAGALAAGTLWAVTVTAGSDTAASALSALWQSLPLSALRWELGDLWPRDGLSAAAVMTIGESPLLLAARPAVAELWTQAEPEPSEEQEDEEFVTAPVEETPLDAPGSVDNGETAKTLIPTDPSGYTVCGKTYISNSTSYRLSVSDLQQAFSAHLAEDGPQILILHTHGSEAYTPAGDAAVVWSGDHRTTDTRYKVVRVGDEMAEVFGQAGISVLHDRTLYDYPSYAGAYDRSLAAIQKYLKQYPSIQFILDVHRDAIEDGQGNQYKVISSIDGEGTAAQLSIVVGSDGSGLTHPNWMENLRLAVAIQENALARYPTLMRPVLLRNSRYNQHAAAGSLLVEVGSAGNSPEEAVLSGRLFAERMTEVLQNQSIGDGG